MDLWFPRACGRRGRVEQGVTTNECRISYGRDKMFQNLIVAMVVQPCEFPKNTELYVLHG